MKDFLIGTIVCLGLMWFSALCIAQWLKDMGAW